MMRCNHLHDYFAEKFPKLVQTILKVTIPFDNSDDILNWPNSLECVWMGECFEGM